MIDCRFIKPFRAEPRSICYFDSGGGSGSTTNTITKTDSTPWAPQGTALSAGYNLAGGVLNTPKSFYPNATYVPASNQTEAGLTQTENLANQGGQLVPAASRQNLATINGDYLNAGNPHFQGMVDQIGQSIRPNIDATFAAAGRGNSGANVGAYSSALADQAGKLAFQNYGQERGFQQQAIGQAPQLDAARFADAQQLMGVGQAREGYAQQQLQDRINRFNFGQNEPSQRIAQYLAMVGGGSFGGQGTSTQSIPTVSNPLLTGLGAAGSAASIAGSLFGRGGVWGS